MSNENKTILYNAYGLIEKFSHYTTNGKAKVEVCLRQKDKSIVFIQFQGRDMDRLSPYSIGQFVKISFIFNGKITNLGKSYNNLIGKIIKLSEPC